MSHPGNVWNPAPPRSDQSRSRHFLILIAVLVITWLAVTGWLVTTAKTVGSPDEAANQYFMRQLAATGDYRVDSGLPAEVNQMLYPRSASRLGADLASGSFLGFVQVGALLIKAFGLGAEKFLTPVLGVLALLTTFLVLRRWWDRRWALATVILIAVHPGWFAMMTTPYLHNGAFTALVVISGWALLRALERPTMWRAIVFGASFGLAMMVRPIEVIWLAPIVAIVLLARKLWLALLIVGFITAAFQIPWLVVNYQLFGAWFASGYTPSGIVSSGDGDEGAVVATVTAPAKLLFTPPGGVWSWHWLSSVWWYFIVLGSPVSVLAIIALGQYLRRAAAGLKTFKLGLLAVPIIFIFIYYGTWDLYPTSTASQIGWFASYVRYWLIIYVATCVGASLAIQKIFDRRVAMMVMTMIILTQVVATIGHVNSGIVHRVRPPEPGRGRLSFILTETEPDSLIIAGQQDKYLFGQRRVAFAWPSDPAGLAAVQSTVAVRPVYLYGTPNQFSEKTLQAELEPYHLRLGPVRHHGSELLWPIIPQP